MARLIYGLDTNAIHYSSIQLSEFPAAAADYEGLVYQYIGNTTENFINGFFYKCTEVSAGNYTIEMVFASDGCYSESNLTASVEIYYDESSVSAEDVTVSYGDEIIVHVVSSGAVNVTYQVIKDGIDVTGGTQV